MEQSGFLPVTAKEMREAGWETPDFVYVTGDAYVDHPSFGVSIISRVLEHAGYRVAILAQPDYKSADDFRRFGKPRLGFLVTSGNIDSMVAHYTAAKRRRSKDYYSPGGVMGKRPDRAVIVYCNRIREAYGDVPIILGGLEASLRRFAHYDYWDDKVRRSVLIDSRADLLTYGMGEKILVRIAELLDKGVPVRKIRDVRGSVWVGKPGDAVHFPVAAEFDFDRLKTDKRYYAEAFGEQYRNQDAISGKALTERYGDKLLVQNPPMPPPGAGRTGRGLRSAVQENLPSDVRGRGRRARDRGGALFGYAQPRVLRCLQLLRAGVPPGAHGALPQYRKRG